MKAIFHPQAGEEFQHAIEVDWKESPDLGRRFYHCVFAAIARIEPHPSAWPRLRGTVRKRLVEDFPTGCSPRSKLTGSLSWL